MFISYIAIVYIITYCYLYLRVSNYYLTANDKFFRHFMVRDMPMVLNATFNNISVIS